MIAFDTNQLMFPTTRRFYMSMQVARGEDVVLLPTVHEELRDKVYEAELIQYSRLCREHALEPRQTRTIARAAAQAARDWLDAEIRRNDSSLCRIDWSRRDDYLELATEIPDACFKGPGVRARDNDRRIVAQALVHGHTLLITDNMASIRTDLLNQWAFTAGHASAPEFVLNANAAARRFSSPERPRGLLFLGWAAGACWPESATLESPPVATIEQFLTTLRNAGLTEFASEAHDALETHPLADRTLAETCAHLPHRARQTELRRVTAARNAAREAGLDH